MDGIDPRIPLISATAQPAWVRPLETVAKRLGRSLLELGGNNAIIISKEADLDMALIGASLALLARPGSAALLPVGSSSGEVYDKFKDKLVRAYGQLRIGNPLDEKNHVGPLIDKDAVKFYEDAISKCKRKVDNSRWRVAY
jgi:aldehyde dehydrogenase (NAD+)